MTSSAKRKEHSRLFLPLLGIFITLYLVLGAILFSLLEAPNELVQRDITKVTIRNMSRDLNVSMDNLTRILLQYDNLVQNGYSATDLVYEKLHTKKWSFVGAFTFCGTVVTTIGFGVATPKTTAGRIVFIIYCLLGCPAVFLFFNTWLSRFITYFTKFMTWAKSKQKPKHKFMRNRFVEREKRRSYKAAPSHVLLALSSLTFFIVLIASVVYHVTESNWNFLTSFYYTTTAYSTIGFGDLTSGQEHTYTNMNRYIYHVIDGILLIIGCCCVYSLFNMISLFFKRFVDRFIRHLKRRFCTSSEDEDFIEESSKDWINDMDFRIASSRNRGDVIVYVKDNIRRIGNVYGSVVASSIRNNYYDDNKNDINSHDVIPDHVIEPPTPPNTEIKSNDSLDYVTDDNPPAEKEHDLAMKSRRMWGALKATLRVRNSQNSQTTNESDMGYGSKSTLRIQNSNNSRDSPKSYSSKSFKKGSTKRYSNSKSRKTTRKKRSTVSKQSIHLNTPVLTPIRGPHDEFAYLDWGPGLRKCASAPDRVGYEHGPSESEFFRVSRSMYAADFQVQREETKDWDENNDVFPLSIMQNQMGT